jgi:hypothetical protein
MVAGLLISPATALAGFGIDPGKVQIDNLYPGATAEFKIGVFNQQDYERTFSVVPRLPDYTEDGYDTFSNLEWISISPHEVLVQPFESAEVTIVILMPEKAEYSGKSSEAWISFKEKDDYNMVQVEIVSRVLINTREEIVDEDLIPDDSLENSFTPTEIPALLTEESEPGKSEIDNTPQTLKTDETSNPVQSINNESKTQNTWIILGIAAGVLIIFEAIYLAVKKRRLRTTQNTDSSF